MKTKFWNRIRKLILIPTLVALIGIQFIGVNLQTDSGKVLITIALESDVMASTTADYTVGVANADVQFNAALLALPATGGVIQCISSGTYKFNANATRAIPNVTIQGTGRGTYLTLDGINPIITAGSDNWTFRDLYTDAGGVSFGATIGGILENVAIGATYYAYRVAGSISTTSSLNDIGTNAIPFGTGHFLDGNFYNDVSVSNNLSVTNNISAAVFDILGNGTIWAVNADGINQIIYQQGGISPTFGYSSSIYFGPNSGNSAGAAFQGGFGIGVLNSCNSSSEGNWGFGDVVMNTGTALRYNVGIGDGTLRWIESSNSTVAIGDHAIYGNPAIVNQGVVAGSEALRGLTSGQRFVAIGRGIAMTATSVIDDVLIGNLACKDLTVSTGGNVIIGSNTGDGITTGGTNIRIGNNAGDGLGNTTSKFALGWRGGNTNTEYLYGDMAPTLSTLSLNAGAAAGLAGFARETKLTLNNNYWTSGGAATFPFTMYHDMTSENATASSNVTFSINAVKALQLENSVGVAGIYISANGTLKKVVEGANDSGGAGYRLLIVTN